MFFYSQAITIQPTGSNSGSQNTSGSQNASGSQNTSGSSVAAQPVLSLEEQFDDNSWSGLTRFDWAGVADPVSESAKLEIFGLWNEYVVYKNIFSSSFYDSAELIQETYEYGSSYVEPQFLLEPYINEQFDDNSWDGLTKIDWTDAKDSASSAGSLELYGVWSGAVLYSSIPQPDFSINSSVFVEAYEYLSTYVQPQFLLEPQIDEQFDDVSWGSLAKIDWTGIENPASSAGSLELYGMWSGTVLYSSIPQPDFNSGASAFTETYEL